MTQKVADLLSIVVHDALAFFIVCTTTQDYRRLLSAIYLMNKSFYVIKMTIDSYHILKYVKWHLLNVSP